MNLRIRRKGRGWRKVVRIGNRVFVVKGLPTGRQLRLLTEEQPVFDANRKALFRSREFRASIVNAFKQAKNEAIENLESADGR